MNVIQNIEAGRQRDPAAAACRTSRGEHAFTMVEIALCLAVIAFALVAIIGVLPTGMRVQKENRADTVINQDGTFLVEAIRSGSRGIDYLTNFFDSIVRSNNSRVTIYTNRPALTQEQDLGNGVFLNGSLTNGLRIVALLTFPKYIPVPGTTEVLTNHISGYIRALSGSAVTRSKSTRDFAFAYQFTAEMVPLSAYPRELTNYQATGLSPEDITVRSNLWALSRNQAKNFNELRLTLQGPVIQRGKSYDVLGTPKTFRTLVSGKLGLVGGFNHFVQPATFVQE